MLIHLDLSKELLVDLSSHVIFVSEEVGIRHGSRIVPQEQLVRRRQVATARCHCLLAVEAILGHLKLLARFLLV